MKTDPIHFRPRGEVADCGRGHACRFCPKEDDCQLDRPGHSQRVVAERLDRINGVIVVAANKGGVGKSTVSANLAVALARLGYEVGLADADVHGPNAPRIVGLQDERVRVGKNGLNIPSCEVAPLGDVEPGTLRVGSLALMLPDARTPVVWRDSYKHDYIHHMIGSFNWGALDFLVIDMPPGTGNELITLFDILGNRNAHVLLVSSADAIVLQDTLKIARHCQESELQVMGLVENYSGTVCPHCAGEIDLFPRSSEIEEFDRAGIGTLARIPFTGDIADGASRGMPAANDDQTVIAELFSGLAAHCRDELVAQARELWRNDSPGGEN